MITIRDDEANITEWAKDNNRFVNGLNYTFNGEDYKYLDLNYVENKALGIIKVTKHLFNEGDFVHLTMTLGLRIILDTIINYIYNKHGIKLESINVSEIHSLKIERIQDLNDISIFIEENNSHIQANDYSGSYLIIFGYKKMLFNCSVLGVIAPDQLMIIRQSNSKYCYDDYRFDISHIYVNQNSSRCNTIVYQNNKYCSLSNSPFSILFNILINQIFVYCSYDTPKNGSRFILATEIHYTQDVTKDVSDSIYLNIQEKIDVKSKPTYKIISVDENNVAKLQMVFLYMVI